MRSSPVFAETRLSLSFFLTTPAKKPRTECCCQCVAFMIAAMLAPFGAQSNFSTADCLEREGVAFDPAAVGEPPLGTVRVFDSGGRLVLVGRLAVRGDLRRELAGLDFLAIAIRLSSCINDSIMVLPPTRAPPSEAGRGRQEAGYGRDNRFSSEAAS